MSLSSVDLLSYQVVLPRIALIIVRLFLSVFAQRWTRPADTCRLPSGMLCSAGSSR